MPCAGDLQAFDAVTWFIVFAPWALKAMAERWSGITLFECWRNFIHAWQLIRSRPNSAAGPTEHDSVGEKRKHSSSHSRLPANSLSPFIFPAPQKNSLISNGLIQSLHYSLRMFSLMGFSTLFYTPRL